MLFFEKSICRGCKDLCYKAEEYADFKHSSTKRRYEGLSYTVKKYRTHQLLSENEQKRSTSPNVRG